MFICCPYCDIKPNSSSAYPKIVRIGTFKRKSDSKEIQRFRCLNCRKCFSTATFHDCFRQNKRSKNELVRRLFCSGVSQRQMARVLNLNRTTIARKLIFLSKKATLLLEINNRMHKKAEIVEFDDLETFEHSKCKPLSVTLAVEHKTRRILAFEVAQMPAKGLLTYKSLKKYGYRNDARFAARNLLFERLKPLVNPCVVFRSDSNPHYPMTIKKHFPKALHQSFLGQRGAITGQGELKKIKFDPLFSLNHTCAKFRAHIARLIRKTWVTTKNRERLRDHIAIYAHYHNQQLIA